MCQERRHAPTELEKSEIAKRGRLKGLGRRVARGHCRCCATPILERGFGAVSVGDLPAAAGVAPPDPLQAIRQQGRDLLGDATQVSGSGGRAAGSSSHPEGSRSNPRDRMAAPAARVEPVAAFAVALREAEFRAARSLRSTFRHQMLWHQCSGQKRWRPALCTG